MRCFTWLNYQWLRNVKIEIAQAYSSFELIIFRKRYERKLSIARHILVPKKKNCWKEARIHLRHLHWNKGHWRFQGIQRDSWDQREPARIPYRRRQEQQKPGRIIRSHANKMREVATRDPKPWPKIADLHNKARVTIKLLTCCVRRSDSWFLVLRGI